MAAVENVKEIIGGLIKKGQFTKVRDLLDNAWHQAVDDKEKKKIEELYEPNIVKGDKLRTLEIDYDAFGEGLEPVYYWILDFIRKMGYKVDKTEDYFAAAEASYWYGDVGAKRSALEKRATELMGTINIVIKSMINLLWDLKEFDMRLKNYKDLAKGGDAAKTADLALKSVFLSEVDIKKGRGALNMLAQELNFITIRDAFMAAKSAADVKGMDLNDRVKRVLEPRVQEYVDWIKVSEHELTERYKIEKAYLKSQVNALKLYTQWARPYLIATNKLTPPEKVEEPEELVSGFNVARMYIEIFGSNEQKLMKTKQPGAPQVVFPAGEEVIRGIEVVFVYRTSPETVERGHYIHRGRVRAIFNAYVLRKRHLIMLKKLKQSELLELVSGMTDDTLSAMQVDLDKYLKDDDKPEEKKKEKKKFIMPIFEGVKDIMRPFKDAADMLKIAPSAPKTDTWMLARAMRDAKDKVKNDMYTIYETYKKGHGMLTPP